MSMFLFAQEAASSDGPGLGAGLLFWAVVIVIVYLAARPKRIKKIGVKGYTTITPKY